MATCNIQDQQPKYEYVVPIKRAFTKSCWKFHANMASGMSGADPEVMAAIDRGNAVVFFDIGLGDGANVAELGRIKLELFVQDVSESVWSMFVKLANGHD
jgi:hypothetical protein